MEFDFTRSQWGAKPAKRVSPLNWAKVVDLILHHPGHKSAIGTDPQHIAVLMRGWQAYHQNVKGWTDFAYNVAVDQLGRLWEGRGWNRVDGGTKNMGGVSFTVLAILGNNEAPSEAMKRTIVAVFEEGRRRHPGARRGWHSMYGSTDCPGDMLRDWGNAGFPLPGEPLSSVSPLEPEVGVSAPWFPLPVGYYFGPRYPLKDVTSVSGYYSHRDDLKVWQQQVRNKGYKISVDGYYGPETRAVARLVQARLGLRVDGLIGARTWAGAWKL